MEAKYIIKKLNTPVFRLGEGFDTDKFEKKTFEGFDTEYVNTLDVFKSEFSKVTKELWEILNNPNGKTHKDIYNQTTKMISYLEFLRAEIKDFSTYSEDEDDYL